MVLVTVHVILPKASTAGVGHCHGILRQLVPAATEHWEDSQAVGQRPQWMGLCHVAGQEGNEICRPHARL